MEEADQLLMEDAARALDPRPYVTARDVWAFINSADAKQMMSRRGVDMSLVSRKNIRTFRKKVYAFVANTTERTGWDNSIYDLASPAQILYELMKHVLELQIHLGRLKLSNGALSGTCHDSNCVLGCRQVMTLGVGNQWLIRKLEGEARNGPNHDDS
jgi:hypothetical protein